MVLPVAVGVNSCEDKATKSQTHGEIQEMQDNLRHDIPSISSDDSRGRSHLSCNKEAKRGMGEAVVSRLRIEGAWTHSPSSIPPRGRRSARERETTSRESMRRMRHPRHALSPENTYRSEC